MLHTPKFNERVGSMYNELNIKSRGALMYHVLFILRRLLFAIAAVIL